MANTKIVIVGAGVGARNVVKALPNRGFDVTVIQPNDFAEFPFSGPLTLAYPELHPRVVTGEAMANAKTIVGVASGMTDGVLKVTSLANKDETQDVPFDYLIAASGFRFPKFLSTPGQTYEERVQEIQSFNDAALAGGDVVIGGGGIIAIEIACNMCEIINKKTAVDSGFNAKVKIVTSGKALCPTYAAKYQALAKARIEALGGEVYLNDRVTSHNEPSSSSGEKFTLELKSGKKFENVSAYLPAFIGKGSCDYLTSMEGVLDPDSNKVILDEFLMSKSYKKLFALGGCAQLVTPESFLGAVKIEEQAKTIVKNIQALIAKRQMVIHREGLPGLSNGGAILMGHHSFATYVPEAMPGPIACICNSCGPPCNLLCPCFCCGVMAGVCDIGCCGCCCGAPQGAGVAAGLRKLTLSGVSAGAMGFNGVGSAMPPPNQRITRS